MISSVIRSEQVSGRHFTPEEIQFSADLHAGGVSTFCKFLFDTKAAFYPQPFDLIIACTHTVNVELDEIFCVELHQTCEHTAVTVFPPYRAAGRLFWKERERDGAERWIWSGNVE